MQIRQHRGTLEDSLKTVTVIEPTVEAMLAWINKEVFGAHHVDDFFLQPYADSRLKKRGWANQFIITRLNNDGVLGFCDSVPTDYGRYVPEVEMSKEDLAALVPEPTPALLPKELDDFLHHWYIEKASFEAGLKTGERIIAATKEAFEQGAEVTVKINRVGDPEISLTYNKARHER